MTFSIIFLTVTVNKRKYNGKQLDAIVRQQQYEQEHEQLVNKLFN